MPDGKIGADDSGRPEAIESVFILYRVTGERAYQDIAWDMFQSIENATKTDIANSAIRDVTEVVPAQTDRMESFWLAETLKYFYLIFSEPELISLDEYVLYVLPCCEPTSLLFAVAPKSKIALLTPSFYLCRNTEAHPLKRPL
jgi:Glycosyl hydrolase family 47